MPTITHYRSHIVEFVDEKVARHLLMFGSELSSRLVIKLKLDEHDFLYAYQLAELAEAMNTWAAAHEQVISVATTQLSPLPNRFLVFDIVFNWSLER